MRTKVVSVFIFFQELSTKKIKALRPKMTKIVSRWGGGGGPALSSMSNTQSIQITYRLSHTTLAKKKMREARMSNYRRVHAREITRLCPLARGCPKFFGHGSTITSSLKSQCRTAHVFALSRTPHNWKKSHIHSSLSCSSLCLQLA